MNFKKEFIKGQEGRNSGLSMGPGLKNINNFLNGIHKGRLYGISSAPKTGKTTFTDYAFVISPYMQSLSKNININWIYFSLEINRINKEFDFVTHFLNKDYNIDKIYLKNNTYNNKDYIYLSSNYLKGLIKDDNNKIIKVDDEIRNKVNEIYYNRITKLFGTYDEKGNKIKNGYIDFIDKRGTDEQIISYIYNKINNMNLNNYNIIIIDHLRKIKIRNGTIKNMLDEFISKCVELKNKYNFIIVNIIHTNRNIQDKLKFYGDRVYNSSDDLKDTGNLAEECDYLITMFNANDDRYKLNEHFKLKIRDNYNRIIYPDRRTLHIVENRYGDSPSHFQVNMNGRLKKFYEFKEIIENGQNDRS